MVTVLLLGSLVGSDTLTLSRALQMAAATRPIVRAAGAAVAAARAAIGVAGAVPNPSVGYSHTQDTPSEHLTVQQPFDWLARRGADRAAARAGVMGAEADSARIAAELNGEVRRAFYGAVAAGEAVRLIEAEARVADSLAVLSGRRLARGDIAAMEHDRVRLEAARVRQLVLRAREAVGLTRLMLRRVIGSSASGSAPIPIGDLSAGLEDPEGRRRIVASAVLPAVSMAQADSAGAAFQVRGARQGRLPVPGFQFGADWADPAQPGRRLWLFGLSVPLPVWNQSGPVVAAATARSDRATALLAEARLEAGRQLATVDLQVRVAAIRARAGRDSLVPAARRLRAQAVLAYQLGETGVLPVLDALRAEREIESAALEDLLAFQEALASWYALVGSAE